MFTLQSDSRWAKFVWLLVAAIFIADLLLPRQFNIVFAYLLAHFMAIFFKEKGDVFLLAVATTTLTIIAVFFKTLDAPVEQILFERIPPVVSFWAAAFFVVHYMVLRDEVGHWVFWVRWRGAGYPRETVCGLPQNGR